MQRVFWKKCFSAAIRQLNSKENFLKHASYGSYLLDFQ